MTNKDPHQQQLQNLITHAASTQGQAQHEKDERRREALREFSENCKDVTRMLLTEYTQKVINAESEDDLDNDTPE